MPVIRPPESIYKYQSQTCHKLAAFGTLENEQEWSFTLISQKWNIDLQLSIFRQSTNRQFYLPKLRSDSFQKYARLRQARIWKSSLRLPDSTGWFFQSGLQHNQKPELPISLQKSMHQALQIFTNHGERVCESQKSFICVNKNLKYSTKVL